MKRIFILFFLTIQAVTGYSQVVVNEYSCSNINGPVDAFGDREDWVELYNTGAAAVNLSGYYLSDDKFTPMKWQVPVGVNIPAGGRMMVFCSDRGVFQSGQLHPSFKLTQMRGEYFVLANGTGAIVDSVKLLPTQANHSRGRSTDGGTNWGVFSTPSPNGVNSAAKANYAQRPLFSVAPGFYNATQSVVLSTPEPNITIHYTTDGSVPTLASPTYSVPINVPVTMVVRAVAFSSDPLVLPSFTETNTYLINETTTMNVVSVAGNYTTLFSGWGGGTEITSSIEYFDVNKNFKFELEGIARPHGHDSWGYAQKGFKLEAKDQYGYDHALKHKFFGSSARDTFNMVILKAGASDQYTPYGGPSNRIHMRDVFCHTLSMKYNLNLDSRNYAPTIVFVNGTYWGVYEIRERVDKDYMEYYYGQTEKKIDHLSYWGGLEVREGSDTGWNNLYSFIMNNNMSLATNYDHVTQYLDVESFAQYFILNTYLVNSDWLNWNTMWWRGRKGQGVKWRYANWDMDNTIGLGQNFTGLNTTGYQNDPCQPFDLFQGSSSIKHTDMLTRLMMNPTFTQLYRTTFIDMLNGPLNCANMLPHFDSLVNVIQPEMQRQITRWGNGTYADWQSNVQWTRDQIVGRCQVIAQKLDSCMDLNPQRISFNVSPSNGGTISMDGTTLTPYVWSKIVEADKVLNLVATPSNAYYFFDHWEKYEVTNTFNPDDTTATVGFDFKKKDSVVAFFRYFNPDSIFVTFDVTPNGKGTIKLDNTVISSYPYTVKLDRKVAYALQATPVNDWRFFNWRKKSPTTNLANSLFDENVTFTFTEADTIIANFQYDPPFADLPNESPLPGLDQTVSFPNAFSPNGDGRNDVFRMVKGKHVKSIHVRIYDRWGNEVFNASDANYGWDGTFKGEPAPIGTYYYVLTAWFDNTFQNSSKMYKGEINLIR
ncbi:MAG: T9SS type B sorting domain-containing protein [Sphingobacteriales bacterium]|nr:MAG: T9SS type B sorting domain-containing protein [Sphingobacteriales bacterium]